MTQVQLAERKQTAKESSTSYASKADFCRIFAEEMDNLYLLSLLLTADPQKAEQCFVAGLDDCAAGNQVFKEWARSWARRAIVKNAIRLIAPEPAPTNDASGRLTLKKIQSAFRDREQPEFKVEMAALLDLDSFQRFAFVMSVLEGYSDHECALLLGSSRESLIEARTKALQQVAQSVQGQIAEQQSKEPLETNGRSILNFKIAAPLATPA